MTTAVYGQTKYGSSVYGRNLNFPQPGVFIFYDGSAKVEPAVTWNVWDYVKQITIRRGRDSELDSISPGTATVLFDNNTRRFDPDSSTGWALWMRPGKQIAITMDWAGTKYHLFRGFMSNIRQIWDLANTDAEVTCTDILATLSRLPSPSSVLDVVVRGDATKEIPAERTFALGARYPLVTGINSVVDVGPYGHHADWHGPEGQVVAPLIYGRIGGAVEIPPTSYIDLGADAAVDANDYLPGRIHDTNWTLEFWVQFKTHGRAVYQVGNGGPFSVEVSEVGVEMRVGNPADNFATALLYASSVALEADKTYHVVIMDGPAFGASGLDLPDIWVNGVRQSTVPARKSSSYTGVPDGYAHVLCPQRDANTQAITLSDVVMWHGRLSVEEIAAHYKAGTTPRSGQTTFDRLKTTLGDAGIWWVPIESGSARTTFSGPQALDTTPTLADVVHQCEAAEQGWIIVRGDGEIEFHGRNRALGDVDRASTAVSTFSGYQYVVGAGYVAIEGGIGDDMLITRVEVATDSGVVVAESPDSESLGIVTRQINVGGVSLSAAKTIADAHLARYGTARTRITSLAGVVAVGGDTDTSQLTAWAQLELGDRVRVVHHPNRLWGSIDMQLLVAGITDDINPQLWTRTLSLVPVPTS